MVFAYFSQDSLKTLEEAHRLVNVNLHNAAQYKTDCEAAEKETKTTVEKLERVEADLLDVSEKLESLRIEKDKAFEEWMSKVNVSSFYYCHMKW